MSYWKQPRKKEKVFSYFLVVGVGVPPPFVEFNIYIMHIDSWKLVVQKGSKMPRALHVKSLLQNRCIPPGDLAGKMVGESLTCCKRLVEPNNGISICQLLGKNTAL